jgi:phthalate 4,5-cis-dihydrodiol dehydrogenase
MTARILRIGVAGLGRGFTLMLPTLERDERVKLVAAADPRRSARERFEADFGGRTYATAEELFDDSSVEVIYLATPHEHHARHACLAASRGKHLLVEKPMAITLAECRAMIDAARAARVQLIVGHSHSFDATVQRARAIIASGEVGAVRMMNAFNYTDFMYRARRPEELDTAKGGGVLFNQAAHQVDVVRYLAGGRAKSVRALTGAWDRSRPSEGAYAALLAFEGGAFASLLYSGYAHFDSDEFSGWVGEGGQKKDPAAYGAARRSLAQTRDPEQEALLKGDSNYGGARYTPGEREAIHHAHFGEIIVSCDRADLRPVPEGVMVHADDERRLEAVPVNRVPRVEVIDELCDAVVHGRAPVHSGEWAMATLEVCLAILESARTGAEVPLRHQVALESR